MVDFCSYLRVSTDAGRASKSVSGKPSPGTLARAGLRPVNRGDQVQGDVLSEKVVWQMLRPYAASTGVDGLPPHDLRTAGRKAESGGRWRA